jgi:hypothetical protein
LPKEDRIMIKKGGESMNKIAKTPLRGKWLVILASMVLCAGMATTQASAAIKPVIHTTNNNFTMMNPGDAGQTGGMNDVEFIWDGTQRHSVATQNQVPNVSFASGCVFFGFTWATHDCVLYGPGTYTVYSACPAGSPGCGVAIPNFPPITFTVGPNQLGVHYLFDWNVTTDIDMINIFDRNAAFSPSAMCTKNPDNGGACPISTCGGASEKPNNFVWDLMSSDFDGDGVNGSPFVDGPFVGESGNMNVMLGSIGVPPHIWPDASPINFGGSSVNKVLTIKNNGDIANNITTIEPLPLPFSIVADTCSGTSVASGGIAQCTVTLHFERPLIGKGPWKTDLLINSDDPGTPTRITLLAGNDAPNSFDLVSPADGATNVDPKTQLTWNIATDPNGDNVSYHVNVCTDPTFVSADCAPATVASRDNKGMFYAGGAGLFMIGITFIGGLKGRKRIVLLLVLTVLVAAGGGVLLSCKTSDKGNTASSVSAGQTSYIAPNLTSGTTYYWRVTADDGQTTNNLTSSVTQSFTTK